jgi:hypothetical protein
MMRITVLKDLENGNYKVNFNLDGEDLGNREVSYEWIRADIISNNREVQYKFEVDFECEHIELDTENDEIFVYVIKTVIDEDNNMSQYDTANKVYKTYSKAQNFAVKLANEMETILIILD